MWFEPVFWHAVAFALFVVLVWVYARKPILAWLDSEIIKIRDEVTRARALRAEAEAALAGYKKKYAEAMIEAEAITRHAKEEAARLKQQADADLKQALERHEYQASERIRFAEADSLAAIRAAAVDSAMAIARKKLGEPTAAASGLIDDAIAELPKLANPKAKAA